MSRSGQAMRSWAVLLRLAGCRCLEPRRRPWELHRAQRRPAAGRPDRQDDRPGRQPAGQFHRASGDDHVCRRRSAARVHSHVCRIRAIEEVNRGEAPERIVIHQPVAKAGNRVNRVGPIIKITPFDSYGRRVLTMMTDNGPLDVIQGITLITPHWTKVEGLLTSELTPLVWDMRIATSSIPARDAARHPGQQYEPQERRPAAARRAAVAAGRAVSGRAERAGRRDRRLSASSSNGRRDPSAAPAARAQHRQRDRSAPQRGPALPGLQPAR